MLKRQPKYKLLVEIKKKNLNQRKLAQAIDVDPAIISKIVNGHLIPSEKEQVLIAEALNTDVRELF